MKIKFGYGVCVTIFLGGVAFCASASDIPAGTYSYTQQGEELIDGQRASITWNIKIKDEKMQLLLCHHGMLRLLVMVNTLFHMKVRN